MTECEAITELREYDDMGFTNDMCDREKESFNMAIKALEKTSDKECSRCRDKGKCAIYDNFNIDYCSDWSVEE